MTLDGVSAPSTRPYLIRALYEWCSDHGLTPYLLVQVDDGVQVPREFVKDGEIVLNISMDATSALKLGNDYIEFKARFGGVARDILVPVHRVMAIYARENGQGMVFPAEESSGVTDSAPVQAGRQAGEVAEPKSPVQLKSVDTTSDDHAVPPTRPSGGGRPTLTRVK